MQINVQYHAVFNIAVVVWEFCTELLRIKSNDKLEHGGVQLRANARHLANNLTADRTYTFSYHICDEVRTRLETQNLVVLFEPVSIWVGRSLK